ncbi:MAG: hypothetical protein Kow0060_18100 [Methylohalobius crimeensis]
MMQTTGAGSKQWRQRIRQPFQWLDRILDYFERTVLIGAILAIAIVSIVNVIARNLGQSLSFANELAQILLVAITFVGVGHGVRMARHIRVSAVHDLLPQGGRKALLIITSFTTSILLFMLGWFAIQYVLNLATTGRIMPSLQLPLYLAYAVVPLGLFVGSAQYLLAGVRNLISKENYLSWHHKDEYELPADALSEVIITDEKNE